VLPLAVTVGATALVARDSHDVDLQAASFVHQFQGVTQSMVVMNGEIEHPNGDLLELTPEISDATVDVVRSAEAMDSASETDGRGLYRHTAGRGTRQRFELTGTLDAEWLRVTTTAGGLAIENRSPETLTACEIRSNSRILVGDIAAGASVTTATTDPLAVGDAVVCALPPTWLKWSAAGATVHSRGSAFVVFHMQPAAPVVADAAR